MTTPNDIITAINGLLSGLYPKETVYINLMPKDFKRPSTLIEIESVEKEDANISTVRMTVEISITGLIKTDGHYNSDTEQLTRRQYELMSLFESGYVKVGDRCITVSATEGTVTFDECTIILSFEYYDDRGDGTRPTPPVMEEINTNIKQED